MRGVNLLPGYRLETRRQMQRIGRWGGGCAAYAVALAGIWAGSHLIWPDSRAAVAAELESLQMQTAGDERTAKQLQPRLRQAQTTLAATRSIGDQPDWSHLVVLAGHLLGEDAVLDTCRIEPAPEPRQATDGDAPGEDSKPTHVSRYSLHLGGFGRSQAAVLAYVRALEMTGLFERVTLIETRGEAFYTGQAIAFKIACILSDREGGRRDP